MRFTICRIVGNELPPRDTPGSKLDCLKWLIATDKAPNARYVYVLNHIIDPDYLSQVREVLHGQEVLDFPFNIDTYRECNPDTASRIRYAISINAARNFGIRYCQHESDFVACLDQECYIEADEIWRVRDRILRDQRDSRRQHYGLVSKRVHISAGPKPEDAPDCEPMVIFRQDALQLFDPQLPFGQRDKLALLSYMGYTVDLKGVRLRGEKARTVGTCIHMSFGDPAVECDIFHRGDLRAASLTQLLNRITEIYGE